MLVVRAALRHAAVSLLSTVVTAFGFLPEAQAFVHQKTSISIPMRDGRSLAADLYRPATTGKWPTIVVQTPYNKSILDPYFTLESQYDSLFKSPYYAWVVADWRGFFASSAAGYPESPTRGQDGYDCIEWAAAQSWSNGKIGSWGYSALGHALLETAQEAPPHLLAGVPIQYYWQEHYDLSYPGGVYQKNRNDSNFGNGYLTRPHPLYDTYWTNLEATSGPVDEVKIPMLHVSGWYDHLTEATLRAMSRVQSGAAAGAVGRQKVLIGPWTHTHQSESQQGQLSYPDAATMAADAALELFDYYLRGVANGYEQRPTYRYYQTNEARWVSSSAWPAPSRTPSRTYFLRGDATLAATQPGGNETPRSYVADPANPVPTLFGAVLDDSNVTTGPGDLRPVEARGDVLTFTTAPLPRGLAIAGRPKVRLQITSTAVDTDVAVRLTQVRGDGSSMLIVDAIQRASLRNGKTAQQLMSPGTAYALEVGLPSIAITIPAGDRLRLLVAPSNYDRFDKNMQDGSSLSDEGTAQATTATVQILLDSAHPSMLELPLTSSVPTPPAAPANLTATAASASAIALSWSDGSSNEDGFSIERSADGTSFTAIATVASGATSYTSTGLAAAKTYYYRVRAFNTAGNSGYTSVASATTPATVPAAPANLRATIVSRNSANLAWDDQSSNESGFKLQRSQGGVTFNPVATLSANSTSYAVTGLKASTTYYFRVYAYNSAGNSAYSNTLTIKTPK